MTPASAVLRVAVCQLRMHWDGAANTAGIVQALRRAAAQGAQVALFPELAVTGIHRQIAAVAQPDLVARWMHAVHSACARHGIAASVGAPTFCDDGRIRIAQHFVDARGQHVGTVHKNGLTAPEATFFVPGAQRPTLALAGRRWSAMICREIDDADAIAGHFASDPPDIVVWPGALRPDPALPRVEPPHHVQRAMAFAQRCAAFVLMVNWPNALNRPEESADAGHSVAIDPQGRIVLTLPRAQAGLGVFDLGAPGFWWTPDDAALVLDFDGSEVAAVQADSATLRVRFAVAQVQRAGGDADGDADADAGYLPGVELLLSGAAASGPLAACVGALGGGRLVIDGHALRQPPLPFEAHGAVSLSLQFRNRERLDVRGTALHLLVPAAARVQASYAC